MLVVGPAPAGGSSCKPSGPARAGSRARSSTLEPIQINLADGHYLRIGIALQLTADAHEADGSKALDATIDLFSGQSTTPTCRSRGSASELKEELAQKLDGELPRRGDGGVLHRVRDPVTQPSPARQLHRASLADVRAAESPQVGPLGADPLLRDRPRARTANPGATRAGPGRSARPQRRRADGVRLPPPDPALARALADAPGRASTGSPARRPPSSRRPCAPSAR